MSSPTPTPSLRHIAEVSGYGVATVSRALSGKGKVSEQARAQIFEVARSLGYQKNPAASAVMEFVRGKRLPSFKGNLAVIGNFPAGFFDWSKIWNWHLKQYLIEESEATGHALDFYHTEDFDGNVERLAEILQARNVRGLIVMRWYKKDEVFFNNFPWNDYSVVSLYPTKFDFFDQVKTWDENNLLIAWTELIQRGYGRVGVVCPYGDLFRHVERLYREEDKVAPIPMLRFDSSLSDKETALLNWYREHQPEVIVCWQNEVPRWIQKAGIRIPEEVAMVHLSLDEDVARFSGIDPRRRALAREIIALVISHVLGNIKGINPTRKCVQISGIWVDGKTCPKLIG